MGAELPSILCGIEVGNGMTIVVPGIVVVAAGVGVGVVGCCRRRAQRRGGEWANLNSMGYAYTCMSELGTGGVGV